MRHAYHNGNPDSQKSPERLEHEVDLTRAQIDRNLDKLTARLSPGELLDQALHMAREQGGEFGHNLGSQVKHNPLPLILTGVGLSWLMMSSNRTYGTQGSAQYASMGSGAGMADKARDSIHKAGDKARDLKGTVHDQMESAQHRAQDMQDQLNRFFREQPIIAGGLGIALGAILGSLLPSTETEDRLMGDISDDAKAKAQATASEQYEKVREKAEEATRSTTQSSGTGHQPSRPQV